MRRGKALAAPVDIHLFAAQGAALGRAGTSALREGAQELAPLAYGVERNFHIGAFPRAEIR